MNIFNAVGIDMLDPPLLRETSHFAITTTVINAKQNFLWTTPEHLIHTWAGRQYHLRSILLGEQAG